MNKNLNQVLITFLILITLSFIFINRDKLNDELFKPPDSGGKFLQRINCTSNKKHRIEECSCDREYFYPPPGENSKKLNSTCSDEGTLYEMSQRVVSMTLYFGNDSDHERRRTYVEGLKLNLKFMREFYPGTTLRLYTDVKLEDEWCSFICNNPDLFWCDIRKTPSLGDQHEMIFRTWRFLPLGDPTVDYFLSRDLDSVITEREAVPVRIWLGSNKPIHVMRDHPDHNGPILAGLWGARNSLLGEAAVDLRDTIMRLAKTKDAMMSKEMDQIILREVLIYPRLSDVLAFDSYHCRVWKSLTEVRPFPTRRKNWVTDFVGNVELGRAVYKISKCPEECRPLYGKDWEFC